MSDVQTDVRAYTLRLELVDEPGELLRALRPIAENGGNLLSIFHERGNVTPRGHIPVEVDMEAPPDRFEKIIEGLRDAGINVIQAGTERYSEGLTVILSGHVIDTDVSDTLSRIQESSNASVTDLSLAAPEGTSNVSSARIGIAAEAGAADVVIERLRDVAAEKDLTLIEPLAGGTPA
ncbi:amino acid-binding protein [Halobellus ordinarius]|uniref:amino acid-binding protein n=1 Tax=Halobellus ordinarius TaxID=3075120 RepID=UPI002880A7D5|nr:amino acid-binding protein [Halobellus sp. ZY16]